MIKRSGPCRTRRRLRGALAGKASAGDLGVALEDALTDPSPSEAMVKSVAYEARRVIPVHEERLKDAFPSRITRHSLRVTEICLADGEVSKVA